jgi:predicted regulator of amino acid metabolism with ACT domain
VILAELEKDNNRRRFESEAHLDLEWQAQATNVERRVLLNQIVRAMDDWTRNVFEWLTLDYSFKEIAQHLGMNHKVLRNKYDRHIRALIRQIREREDDNGGS